MKEQKSEEKFESKYHRQDYEATTTVKLPEPKTTRKAPADKGVFQHPDTQRPRFQPKLQESGEKKTVKEMESKFQHPAYTTAKPKATEKPAETKVEPAGEPSEPLSYEEWQRQKYEQKQLKKQ